MGHGRSSVRSSPSKRLSEERLKCLWLARKVGLDKLKEDDVKPLLESIGEELSTEELDELDKQRRQLEKVEAEQHPTAPPMKQLIMKILQHFLGIMNQGLYYLEKVDPDYERAGLARRRVMANLSHYEQLLYEKRREAMQAILDAFFRKASLPEAFASDEPQPSNSTGSSSTLQPQQAGTYATFGECNYYFCILKCLFHLYSLFLYSILKCLSLLLEVCKSIESC